MVNLQLVSQGHPSKSHLVDSFAFKWHSTLAFDWLCVENEVPLQERNVFDFHFTLFCPSLFSYHVRQKNVIAYAALFIVVQHYE
jgi:hypothetical protein